MKRNVVPYDVGDPWGWCHGVVGLLVMEDWIEL